MVVVGGYKAYRRGLAKAKTAVQRAAVIRGYSAWRAKRAIATGGAVTRAGVVISAQEVSARRTQLSQTLANLKRLELAKRDIEAGKSIREAYAGRRTVGEWLKTPEGKTALAEATTAAKIQYELIAAREAAAKAEIERAEAERKAAEAEERAKKQRMTTFGISESERLGLIEAGTEVLKERAPELLLLPPIRKEMMPIIRKAVIPKVKEVGEKIMVSLAKAADWIEKTRLKYLEPTEYKTQKEIDDSATTLSNAVDVAEKKAEKINEDVEAFVEKYPENVELTEAQAKKAEDEAYRLRERIERWEGNEVLLKQNIRDHELKTRIAEAEFGLKWVSSKLPERVLYSSAYASYYLAAIPRMGLGYAALTVGLATRPVETVREVARGIKEFPSEFMKKPLRTMMDIAAAVTFWYLAEAGISALARGKIKFFKGKRARVGRKGKSKTVQKVVQKVKEAKKKKAKVKLTTIEAEETARTIIHRVEKKWMVGGQSAAEAEVRRLLTLVKTVQERQGFEFLLKHLYDKNLIRSYIFDVNTGRLVWTAPPKVFIPPKVKPPIVKVKPPIVKVKPPKVRVKPKVIVKPVVKLKVPMKEATAILLARQRAALKEREKQLQALYGITMPRVKVKVVAKPAIAPAQVFGQAMTGRVAPVPAPAVPAPPAPPITPVEVAEFITGVPPRKKTKEEIEAEKKRRKEREAQLRAMALAYQASVGAIALGIAVTPEEARRLELERRKFIGIELRPVIRRPSRQVSPMIAMQRTLMSPAIGTARKGSPRKATKALRKKQFELAAPAYATAKRTYKVKKVKTNAKVKKVKVRSPRRGVRMLQAQQALLGEEMLQYAKGYIAKKKTKKRKKEKRRKTANIARLLIG